MSESRQHSTVSVMSLRVILLSIGLATEPHGAVMFWQVSRQLRNLELGASLTLNNKNPPLF
jgi:hypothetical protein